MSQLSAFFPGQPAPVSARSPFSPQPPSFCLAPPGLHTSTSHLHSPFSPVPAAAATTAAHFSCSPAFSVAAAPSPFGYNGGGVRNNDPWQSSLSFSPTSPSSSSSSSPFSSSFSCSQSPSKASASLTASPWKAHSKAASPYSHDPKHLDDLENSPAPLIKGGSRFSVRRVKRVMSFGDIFKPWRWSVRRPSTQRIAPAAAMTEHLSPSKNKPLSPRKPSLTRRGALESLSLPLALNMPAAAASAASDGAMSAASSFEHSHKQHRPHHVEMAGPRMEEESVPRQDVHATEHAQTAFSVAGTAAATAPSFPLPSIIPAGEYSTPPLSQQRARTACVAAGVPVSALAAALTLSTNTTTTTPTTPTTSSHAPAAPAPASPSVHATSPSSISSAAPTTTSPSATLAASLSSVSIFSLAPTAPTAPGAVTNAAPAIKNATNFYSPRSKPPPAPFPSAHPTPTFTHPPAPAPAPAPKSSPLLGRSVSLRVHPTELSTTTAATAATHPDNNRVHGQDSHANTHPVPPSPHQSIPAALAAHVGGREQGRGRGLLKRAGSMDSLAKKSLHFCEEVLVMATYSTTDYDRKGERPWMCLTMADKIAIKEELNGFKKEMDIHPDSEHMTRFHK